MLLIKGLFVKRNFWSWSCACACWCSCHERPVTILSEDWRSLVKPGKFKVYSLFTTESTYLERKCWIRTCQKCWKYQILYKKKEWSEQLPVNDEEEELAASRLALFLHHGTLGLNANASGDVSNKRETHFLTLFPHSLIMCSTCWRSMSVRSRKTDSTPLSISNTCAWWTPRRLRRSGPR